MLYIILWLHEACNLKEVNDLEGVEDHLRAVRDVSEQPKGELLVERDQAFRPGLIK